ncbi:MAG TPA: hypothetical protein VF101_10820 [Gaiellaceae bacterium]
MKTLRTLVSISILTLALGAANATAAAPTVTETHVDRTRVVAANPDTCPFDFVVHSEGFRRDTLFSDGRSTILLHDFTVTYTNPAAGKSVRSVLAGPVIVEPNADGTITVIVDGNDGLFTIPGEGIVFGDVGRLVYVASPDDPFTPLEILQSTGHQDPSPFPAVCAGLV